MEDVEKEIDSKTDEINLEITGDKIVNSNEVNL